MECQKEVYMKEIMELLEKCNDLPLLDLIQKLLTESI